VYGLGPIPGDGRLEQVKGKTYSIEELLDDPQEAALFREGVQATLYLSPAAYHRVHWPVEGRVRTWRRIPGRLYPVNPLAQRHVDRLFAVNQRTAVSVDGDDLGAVAVVLVGATNVGRITLAFDDAATSGDRKSGALTPSRPVEGRRGDDLGAFNLGSTVVLLVADGRLVPAGPAAGDTVKMGQALWRRV
jgi:phosphatidylserine decarboxylase